MPVKQPFYGIPEFQPTGIAEVDKSLSKFRQDFGASYTRNLYEAERIPFTLSTFTTGTLVLSTISTWGTTVVSMNVGFQGGESVIVTGNCRLRVEGGGAGTVTFADATLFVNTPDGTTDSFADRIMSVRLTEFSTGQFIEQTVAQSWKPTIRIQTGGLHTFSIRGRKTTLAASGQIKDAALVIFAF